MAATMIEEMHMVDGPVDVSTATTPVLVRQYVDIKVRMRQRDSLTLRSRTTMMNRLSLLVEELKKRDVLD